MSLIPKAGEYAIRALAYLAQRPSQDFQLARDMAATLEIPAPFLAKILQPLVAGGFVHSQRGRSGGFRLAKAPAEIRLFDILEQLEPPSRRNKRECMLGQAECTDERACPLHHYWKPTSDKYWATLRETTLADLTRFCEHRPNCGYPVPNARAASPFAE